jgi:PAS domain S-box-containing protein
MERALEEKAAILTQTVAELIVSNVIDGEVLVVREVLQDIVRRTKNVQFVYVVGFDGNPFSHSFEGGFPKAFVHRRHTLVHSDLPELNKYMTKAGPILEVGYPLIDGMLARIHVGMNESYVLSQIRRMRDRIMIVTLGVTFLGMMFGVVLSYQISRPLKRLADSMRDFGKGKVSNEIGFPGGGREITELTRSFNLMMVERKRLEEKTNHLNAVLHSIRKVNQLIISEQSCERLIQGTCNNLIETRGFHNAWIALIDNPAGSVKMAEAGFGRDFLPMVKRMKHGELPACVRKTLVQPGVLVIENPSSTCHGCPLAEKCQDKIAMSVRLEYRGKVYGLLNVSIPKDFSRDEEEKSLFNEVAGDIAFALYRIDLEEERRKAVEALQQSELFNSALFEYNPIETIVLDLEGRVVRFNLAEKNSSDKLPNIGDVMYRDYAGRHEIDMYEELMKCIRSGKPKEFPEQKYGDEFLSITISPFLDGAIIISRNVTERKRLENELKEHAKDLEKKVEERTKTVAEERDKIDGILKSMADGLLVTDLKHRVLLINPALEFLLEVKAEEIIGHRIWEKIKDSRLKKIIQDTLSKKESGYTVDFEMEDPISKRTKVLRARTAVMHDSSGNPFGTVTIMHDITRECEIDKLKSEFLSTAAHELRTPLTVIQGFSYILATRKDLDEKRKQHFLKLINDESGHLAKIISDLLDISRIESGRGLEIHEENIRLSEIMHKVVMSFKETSPKHEFILICPPDVKKCQVFADRDKISQVVVNVLNNAIKYSPEGGKITISGKRLKDKIQISIKDEGIGIAEKDIAHIFDKFHRVDNLTTRKVEGTGLGLSIVKYIVERHGGNITVESTLGKGSTFSVILPLMEQDRN